MLSYQETVIRLVLAAAFGAAVGLERERKNWAAGMRTHMMVCLGASLMMMVSSFGFSDILKTGHVTLDPSRVAAQVVSGIGFLGAGTIMFLKQGIVKGLTTASGLWTVAGIGLACGGGMYFAALIATIFVVIILWILQPLEKRLVQRYAPRILRLTLTNDTNPMRFVDEWLDTEQLKLANLFFDKANNEITIEIGFQGQKDKEILAAIDKIQHHSSIKEIAWRK